MSIALRVMTTLACAASLLAAAPANAEPPLPPGPYQSTCKDFKVSTRDGIEHSLTASCQNKKGEWLPSTITFNPQRTMPIANCNGQLKDVRTMQTCR
ncbi:MAG: hypothetical protein RLY71_3428 [Pseudomonadota bacterium]|jgi:predicted secreted protein